MAYHCTNLIIAIFELSIILGTLSCAPSLLYGEIYFMVNNRMMKLKSHNDYKYVIKDMSLLFKDIEN